MPAWRPPAASSSSILKRITTAERGKKHRAGIAVIPNGLFVGGLPIALWRRIALAASARRGFRHQDGDRVTNMAKVSADAKRPVLLAAIMLATLMVAVEATIVATAMPRIVGQLGGFAYYSWVFSGYLLAQCTMTLIFGKLSDIFGRKPIMIVGILIFLSGSLLAGLAGSMAWLIGFRVLQGIGAGGVQPMTVTLIGDLYTPAERPRIQGIVASVWAGAAVLGPLAGGIIVGHLSWGWIFWVNLPIGALTLAIFAIVLREDVSARKARIDYLGAVLFAIAIVCFLFILTAAGLRTSSLIGLAAICAVSAVLFVFQELRAPEPMISIALWSNRLVAISNAASFFSGMALVGVTTILPLYVQGVMSRSPVVAGVTLTTLLLGWPLTMTLSSRLFRTYGVGRTLRVGCLTFPAGAAILLLQTPQSGLALASVGSFAMGMGMGLISITSIVLVQEHVERAMRGSATSSVLFSRSFGNALGATVMGAILALGIAHFGQAGQSRDLRRLLDAPTGLSELARDAGLQSVFDAALHWSFWGVLIVAVLTVAAAWMLPGTPPSNRPR
jgi:EmrB/QacA subfamily drug resistance transporter